MDSSQNPRVIEKKLNQIQASTRTTLPLFIRPHNWLRMHSSLYYKWHLLPFVKALHVLVLVAFLTNSIFFVRNSLFYISPVQALIEAGAVDLATSTKWNIRIDGAAEGDILAGRGLVAGDIDGDGLQDLAILATGADNNSRNLSGSVYIIFGSLLATYASTPGTTIDLSDSSKYSIRFDGATAGSSQSIAETTDLPAPLLQMVNLDGDNRSDLVMNFPGESNNSRSLSGSVYLIKDELITGYTGTGNTVDLATSSNWNIRVDGAGAGQTLRARGKIGDLNGNGVSDLVLSSGQTSFNSRSASGSIYVIFDSLLAAGTGNTLDMNETSHYNIRLDGSAANENVGTSTMVSDLDDNGKNDLLFGAGADKNGRNNSGSLYIIYDSIIDDYYSGTGNTVDLLTASNYNVRIDGANSPEGIAFFSQPILVDMDANGRKDLVVGGKGFSSVRSQAGGGYLIRDGLLNSWTGTGNNIDLATTTNWNVRFDGVATGDWTTEQGIATANYFGTGVPDLIFTARRTDFNDRADSGSLFVMANSLLTSLSGTGNTLDLNNSANYTLRYDGATASDQMVLIGAEPTDLNGDHSPDLFFTSMFTDPNSRANAGSVYIIYNFPHTFSSVLSADESTSSTRIVTGSVNATSSTTSIAKVQYNIGSNSPSSGSWTDCSATDGAFNTTSEAFSCSLTITSTGTSTVYLRTKDTHGAYSAVNHYSAINLTLSSVTPVPEASSVATSSDTTAPSLTLKTIGTGTFKSTTTKFTYTASKPQPVFAGTSESGATVTVKTGDTTLCTTTAKSDGTWSCKTTSVLKFQDYKITLTASDSAGNTTTHRTFTLVVAEPQAGQSESAVSSEEDTSLDPALEIVASTAAKETVLSALPVYETQVVTTASGDALTVWKVKVKDRKDQPLASAPVSLSTTDQAAVTDEQGIATFMNVPLGDHELVYESKSKTFRARVQALLPSGLANTKGTFTLLPADVTLPLGGPPLPWPAMVLVILLAPMIGGFIMYELTKHRVRSWEGLFERKKELTNFLP